MLYYKLKSLIYITIYNFKSFIGCMCLFKFTKGLFVR